MQGLGVLLIALLVLTASRGEAQDLREVFRRVSPSVVVVRTTAKEPVFENDQLQNRPIPGLGSGVVISRDGQVLTAAHVVQTADEIFVQFAGGEVVTGKVVASEPEADLALVQLDRLPPRAVVAKLGDSDKVQIGEQIFVVGAPYGMGYTMTVGHISGRRKPPPRYGWFSLAEFLQTDAAINPGNSGGPMFTLAGEVVGIVSNIITKSGGFEGIGFVVSVNMARRVLLEQRSFWTGLHGYALSGSLAKALNVPQPVALLVQRVAERSPAAQIGLRGGGMKATIDGRSIALGGDIILQVHGIPIVDDSSYSKIQEALNRVRSGDQVVVTVLREGRRMDLTWRAP